MPPTTGRALRGQVGAKTSPSCMGNSTAVKQNEAKFIIGRSVQGRERADCRTGCWGGRVGGGDLLAKERHPPRPLPRRPVSALCVASHRACCPLSLQVQSSSAGSSCGEERELSLSILYKSCYTTAHESKECVYSKITREERSRCLFRRGLFWVLWDRSPRAADSPSWLGTGT